MRVWITLLISLALAGCASGARVSVDATIAPATSQAAVTDAAPTITPEPTATATAQPAPTATPAPTLTPTDPAPAVLMRLDPPIHHEQVAQVQQRLAALGYAAQTTFEAGVYDAATEAAVLHFEWINGLPLDGAVDAATAARLAAPDALAFRLPPPFAGRILRRGMYVHALELPLIDRLVALGYLPDASLGQQGKFEREEEAALREFQRANGLPATGLLDLPTWEMAFHPRALNRRGLPANGGLSDLPGPAWFPPGWSGAAIPLGYAPGAGPLLALAEGGRVWVARGDGTLLWYEPASGQLHGPIFIGDLNLQDSPTTPLGMAAQGGRLWVYAAVPGGQLLQGFELAGGPSSVGLARPPLLLPDPPGGAPAGRAFGFDGRRVWLSGQGVAGLPARTIETGLRAVHPTNGVLIFPRALPAAPDGPLAFDGRCLWAYLIDGTITSVDPGLGACTYPGRALPVGSGPTPRFAARDGLLWLAPQDSPLLKQYDTTSGTLRAVEKFNNPIRLLTILDGVLWVGESAPGEGAGSGDASGTGRLTPLDPLTGARGPTIDPGCLPAALAAGPGLWVACEDQTLRGVGE